MIEGASRPALRASGTRLPDASPDVTFLVAAYNVADFIEAAIASAANQAGVNVEVVVVDDGSDDGTAERVERLAAADARVRLIGSGRRRAGPAAARNLAIASARGRWLAVLDGDDLIEPQRARRLLDLAEATSADVVADNFERMTLRGAPTGATLFPYRAPPHAFVVDTAAFLRGNLIVGRPSISLGAIKPIISAEFVARHALRFPEDVLIGEDFHFLLEALLLGARFHVLSEPLYKYRIRPGSQSWRLKPGQPERLIEAFRRTRFEERMAPSRAARAAGRAYETALHRASRLVDVIERAKGGDIRGALHAAARNPSCWRDLVRTGIAAISNRLFTRPGQRTA